MHVSFAPPNVSLAFPSPQSPHVTTLPNSVGMKASSLWLCSKVEPKLYYCDSAPQFPYLYIEGRSMSLPVLRVCDYEKPVPPPAPTLAS